MDTLPTPLDALRAAHGGLGDFRLSAPPEIAAMLRRLQDGNVALNLNAPAGDCYATTLWAADAARGVLSFSASANDQRVHALLEADECVAVGYLDNIKVQFDVHHLVLVHGGKSSALNTAYPRELFRFQRRGGYRVRPVLSNTPVARLRHPMIPEMQLALRVLDVSLGGCALFLPNDVPPIEPGGLLNNVQIELDPDTRLRTSLRLQHVTALNAESKGSRLGCEIVATVGDTLRLLQRYIDQTQKRRRLMALG